FLIASLVALFVLPSLLQPDDVELPDLEGELLEDAIDILTELELESEEDEMYSEAFEEGHIVMTDPEADSSVKVGTTITLYVSKVAEPVSFPDYLGQSFNQVERLLLQQHYQDVRRVDTYSDQPEGQIISQDPEAGSDVIPSETTPVFEVSIGERMVELENLEDMNLDAARQYLEDKGLVPNITEEYSATFNEGRVIRHSPQAGEELEEGSIVNLVVSLGEKEQSPLTHTL